MTTGGIGNRRALWIAGAIGVALVAAALYARHARQMFPVGDIALIEISTLLAGHGDLLVGSYSRFGWRHPGPLYFWIAAPFYALSGYQSAGLHVAVVAINVGSVALVCWIAARFASRSLGVVLPVATAAYLWRMQGMFLSDWNPHVSLFPALALAVVCAAVASGELSLLPVAAFLATFIAQTHVAFLPYAVILPIVAGAIALGGALSASGLSIDAKTRRALTVTFDVLAVLWIAPVIEEILHTPGNLSRLWHFFVNEHHDGQPIAMALEVWADQLAGVFRADFRPAAAGMFAPSATSWPLPWSMVQVLLVAAAATWFALKRRRFEAALSAMALVASFVALWSISRVVGEIVEYGVVWISAVGMLNTAVIVAAAVALVSERVAPHRSAWPTTVAAMCTAGVMVWTGGRWLDFADGRSRASNAEIYDENEVRPLFEGIRTYQRETGARRLLLQTTMETWPSAAGVGLQLERAGIAFAADGPAAFLFPDALAPTGAEDAEVTIATPAHHRELLARPNNVVVAAADKNRVYADIVPLISRRR